MRQDRKGESNFTKEVEYLFTNEWRCGSLGVVLCYRENEMLGLCGYSERSYCWGAVTLQWQSLDVGPVSTTTKQPVARSER